MLALPKLRNDQAAIAKHPAKVKVLAAGRRWGKTLLGGRIVMEVLRRHGKAAWIAPTYKNSRPLWRWAMQVVVPCVQAGLMTVSRAERVVETRLGGLLAIYSGDNIDAVRGEAFHCVVLDEAARLPPEAWYDAVLPTLADFGGDALLISTPKGKNWFWHEHRRSAQPGEERAAWHAPTSDNPLPQIRRAFELARRSVPELTFRQEWLAEFVEAGVVFRKVSEAAVAQPQAEGVRGHEYVVGVDWGKFDDFTVFAVFDVTLRSLVHLERFNQLDYLIQLERLRSLFLRFRPSALIVERNAAGEPLVEQLRRDGLPVVAFTTTAATKAQIVESLMLAFERQEIRIIPDPTLLGELQAFEASRLPSGMMRYSAPEGLHDDCVMALALAHHGAQMAPGVVKDFWS